MLQQKMFGCLVHIGFIHAVLLGLIFSRSAYGQLPQALRIELALQQALHSYVAGQSCDEAATAIVIHVRNTIFEKRGRDADVRDAAWILSSAANRYLDDDSSGLNELLSEAKSLSKREVRVETVDEYEDFIREVTDPEIQKIFLGFLRPVVTCHGIGVSVGGAAGLNREPEGSLVYLPVGGSVTAKLKLSACVSTAGKAWFEVTPSAGGSFRAHGAIVGVSVGFGELTRKQKREKPWDDLPIDYSSNASLHEAFLVDLNEEAMEGNIMTDSTRGAHNELGIGLFQGLADNVLTNLHVQLTPKFDREAYLLGIVKGLSLRSRE